MKDDSPTEAARRIAEWYPHMATPNEYDRDAYTVARAYLRAVEAWDEAIKMCAKIADAEGLSPNASASYCAAAFHIGMCIRALKNKPLNT